MNDYDSDEEGEEGEGEQERKDKQQRSKDNIATQKKLDKLLKEIKGEKNSDDEADDKKKGDNNEDARVRKVILKYDKEINPF